MALEDTVVDGDIVYDSVISVVHIPDGRSSDPCDVRPILRNDVRSRRDERSQDRFNRRSTIHTLHPYAKRQHSRVSQNPSTLKFRRALGRIFALDSPTKSSRVSFRPAAGPLRSNESSCAFRTRQRDRRSTFRRNFCFQRCTVIVIPADRPQSSFQRSLLHHGNLLRLPPYRPSLRTCHPWILVETIFLSNRFSHDYQDTNEKTERSNDTYEDSSDPEALRHHRLRNRASCLSIVLFGPRLTLCCRSLENESTRKRVGCETNAERCLSLETIFHTRVTLSDVSIATLSRPRSTQRSE